MKLNYYLDFEWPCHNAATAVRKVALERIDSKRDWRWLDDSSLDLRELCFSGYYQTGEYWKFELYDSLRKTHVGYGVFTKQNSSKELFFDYLFLVLSDYTIVETWTYNKDKTRTEICVNGQLVGHIKSSWDKFLFKGLSWQSRWEYYCKGEKIGVVERGDYLFGKKVFCKDLVKFDTLKLRRENKEDVPIMLADNPGTLIDALLSPLRVVCGEIRSFDFVVPCGETMSSDMEVLYSFILNVIFRKVYFSMSEPGT